MSVQEKINSRASGAKLFNHEKEGQEDCEKIAKIESRRVGRVCVCQWQAQLLHATKLLHVSLDFNHVI